MHPSCLRFAPIVLASTTLLSTACDTRYTRVGPSEEHAPRLDASAESGPWPGADTPPEPPLIELEVEYLPSARSTAAEQVVFGLPDNALFKLGENGVRIRTSDGRALDRVEVFLDEESTAAASAVADGAVSIETRLPTDTWVEGVHDIRYVVTLVDGTVVEGSEQVRILLNVTALAPGARGAFWLGTFEQGLVAWDPGADRFDPTDDTYEVVGGQGIELGLFGPRAFDRMGEPTQPGGRAILALAPEPGGLWVGAALGGLTWLDDGGTPLHRADDRAALVIPMGRSTKGVERGEELLNSVSAIAPDGADGVWVGTWDGLFHLDHGGTRLDPTDDRWTAYASEGAYDRNIARLAVDPQGNVWIASFDVQDDGSTRNTATVLIRGPRRSADRWVRLEPPDDFPGAAVTVAIGPDGFKYWGTTNGVYGLDDGGTPAAPEDDRWWRLGCDAGLPDCDVAAIVARPDGRLWVGMFDACTGDGGGLALVEGAPCVEGTCPAPLAVFRRADGLLDDDVSSILPLPSGEVFLGTFNFLATPVLEMLGLIERAHPGDPNAPCPQPQAERNLAPGRDRNTTPSEPWVPAERSTSGVDGLSVVDPGAALDSTEDDRIVNF